MDLLLILTYTALCVVAFKVFKIPLNKWSVPTAALGGVFAKRQPELPVDDQLDRHGPTHGFLGRCGDGFVVGVGV